MRDFRPTHQYDCTEFLSMDPELFQELFLANIDKWACKRSTNYQKKYTVRFMKINGATIENLAPFVVSNPYEFFAKLRAKVRDASNRELFSYELAMDIIDEYMENERLQSQPDMFISLENIVDAYIDSELCDGSQQYDLKLDVEIIRWGLNHDTDDESEDDTDDDTDDESEDDTVVDTVVGSED